MVVFDAIYPPNRVSSTVYQDPSFLDMQASMWTSYATGNTTPTLGLTPTGSYPVIYPSSSTTRVEEVEELKRSTLNLIGIIPLSFHNTKETEIKVRGYSQFITRKR
jgi:hypothetical protein